MKNVFKEWKLKKQIKTRTIHHFKVTNGLEGKNIFNEEKIRLFVLKKVEMIENNVFWRGMRW